MNRGFCLRRRTNKGYKKARLPKCVGSLASLIIGVILLLVVWRFQLISDSFSAWQGLHNSQPPHMFLNYW